MTQLPDEYRWSSYGSNAHSQPCGFLAPHAAYVELGQSPETRQAAYRRLFQESMSGNIVEEIRSATPRGHVLGSDKFKNDLESSTGRRVRPGQVGRPRRKRILP